MRNEKNGYDLQSVLSTAGKLSCRRTAVLLLLLLLLMRLMKTESGEHSGNGDGSQQTNCTQSNARHTWRSVMVS